METAKNSLSKRSNSDLVALLNKGSMKTLLIIFLLYATNEQMNVTKNKAAKKINDQLYILLPSLLNHMLQKTNLFFHFSRKKMNKPKLIYSITLVFTIIIRHFVSAIFVDQIMVIERDTNQSLVVLFRWFYVREEKKSIYSSNYTE